MQDLCWTVGSDSGRVGGPDGAEDTGRKENDTTGTFRRHCNRISSFVGRDRSSIATWPTSQIRTCISGPGEPLTGRTTSVQHEIITSDGRPIMLWASSIGAGRTADRAGVCQRHVTWLLGGQIEPSDSPWASPVVLVTKKDGYTRFCVDYRWLNSLTTKDAYPLPRIDDSLRLLGNQQWFSTMDLAGGYWQVTMSPEAKRKAAFVTNEGLFQFRVMPFGLCNAPATFERLMDRVLCGMRWSRCLVYLDDVISFGKSIPDSLARLEEVLARLSDFGLQLKAKKCTFMHTEVGFLGHIVGRNGLACDPEKNIGGKKLARTG